MRISNNYISNLNKPRTRSINANSPKQSYNNITFGKAPTIPAYFGIILPDQTQRIKAKFKAYTGEEHLISIQDSDVKKFFTDKDGNISSDYVNYFIQFYKESFDTFLKKHNENKERNRAIIRGELRLTDQFEEKKPAANIFPFNRQIDLEMKREEMIRTHSVPIEVEIAKNLMLHDKEFKQQIAPDSYKDAIRMIAMCRTKDGIDLSDMEMKKNLLFVFRGLESDWQKDFSEAIINQSKDEEGKTDVKFAHFLAKVAANSSYDPQKGFDNITKLVKPIYKANSDKVDPLVFFLIEFSQIIDYDTPEYTDYLSYCVKNNRFDRTRYNALHNLCTASLNWQLDNYNKFSEEEFIKIQRKMIDSYFSQYKNKSSYIDLDASFAWTNEFFNKKQEAD